MKHVLSLFGGLALGACLAMLLTPYTGEELRNRIKVLAKEKMPDLSGDALDRFVDEVLEKVRKEKPEAAEEA